MNFHPGKIVDLKLVQKGQLKDGLESQTCVQLLTEFTNKYNYEIELLFTDRHKGIYAYIKKQKTKTMDEFDT